MKKHTDEKVYCTYCCENEVVLNGEPHEDVCNECKKDKDIQEELKIKLKGGEEK